MFISLCKIGIHKFKPNVDKAAINFPQGHYLKNNTNIRTRFCHKCGLKQRKSFLHSKWIEMKLNRCEDREYKLNILLKNGKN